ncbi:uncharacterized protein UTRI_03491 [Ustilago trichophora]|uniref:Transcription factor tau subunit sfc3/Tfc3 C-terminal domain-containing protein n=1 Tax=Ustilago trichophora TaxID=86804 RepID=A0A5C3E0I7_9BASI|nr:uncharacterized protein UTRI_03491 [Ustilago trichophora]
MIDELIHYCIEQIGLDGEAGTEIDRLATFIRHFHAEHSSRSHLPDQLVDASYQAFVFRQLVSHPDVSVGLFMPGVPVKSGAKSGITRKASALDSPATPKATSQTEASPEYDWVDLLPDQELAEQQGLFQLQQQHKDRLRLVLQTHLIKRLLVGASDVFLPPSTYRVLQIICRSRETPVLSLDIGTALHTDQKTVFYICKRLIDLHLVTKIKARETGTVASYFVATRFEDCCDILIQQRNAQIDSDLHRPGPAAPAGQPSLLAQSFSRLNETSADQMDLADDDDVEGEAEAEAEAEDATQDAFAPTITVKEEESQDMPFAQDRNHDVRSDAYASAQSLVTSFEHVDAAKSLLWLKSRPELVRFRIYLICNSTSSNVTARLGLLRRIRLAETRPQRKAFIRFLEHAVVDGFLEVVNIHVASTDRTYRGLRMTSLGENEMHELLRGEFGDAATLQEQDRARRLNAKLQQDLTRVDSCIPRELTLERFVYEQVARAGPSGRTISQLMTQLHATGHSARMLDQIAQRAEEADGEPSLSDLQIRSFHEHKQRVRSTKLYSHHAWVLQGANAGYLEPDDLELLASAGGASSFHRKSTAWTAPEQIADRLASLSKDLFTPTPRRSTARIGRPPKKRPLDDDFDPNTPPPKRGRPRKRPIDADLETPAADTPPPKRGRPRKYPLEADTGTPAADTPPPKRGRPRKHPIESDAVTPAASTPPPKRGRPRKHPVEATEASPAATDAAPSRDETPALPNDHQAAFSTAATPSQSEQSNALDIAMDDGTSLAIPDSPTAGLAKRRSRRLLQEQVSTRPTSLLASSPVVAEEPAASRAEEAAVSEPAVSTPPATTSPVTSPPPGPATTQQIEGQDSLQVTQDNAIAPEPAASSADLSHVGDLLLAPTPIKTEVRSSALNTSAAKKLRDATSTPTASASERRKRTNLTQLRSSHALVQCIREAGGAMDTLLIPDLLTDFVEKFGFASDAQLSNLRDRKVREKALTAAVNNGLLRRTYIRLDRPSAQHPKRQIVYVPELPAEQLQNYCEAVKEGRDGWTESKNLNTALTNVTDSVAIGFGDASRFAKPWHIQEPFYLSELPIDQTQLALLRQPFRDVVSSLRQHIGFLSGEMLRLKAFHHACAKFITLRQSDSSSSAPSALPLSFFWTEAPLDLYLALKPVLPMSEGLEQMLIDPQMRATPVQALPDELKASLGLSSRVVNETQVAFYSLATQLSDLDIVKIHSLADDGAIDSQTTASSLNAISTSVEPCHRIPLYNWAVEQQQKPLLGVIDVGLDADKINLFWAKMQACCLNWRKCMDGKDGENQRVVAASDFVSSSGLTDVEPFKTPPEELAYALYASRAWRPYHQLRPSQIKFLYRIDLQDLPSASQDDLDRLAYITLVPPQVVRALLQHRLQRADADELADPEKIRRKFSRFSWPLRLSTVILPVDVYRPVSAASQKRKRTQAEREKEGRATTLAKARQLRQKREEDFQAMIDQAFGDAPAAHDLRPKIETALDVIRKKFVAGDVKFGADAVQKAIARAIRSASGVRLMPAVRSPSAGRRKRQARQDSAQQNPDSEQLDQDQDANGEDDAAGARANRARRERRNRRRNTDHVHFWNPTRKELLRDAAVILRVRDQVRGRSDWSALFQVIDGEEKTKTKGVIMAQWRHQYYRMRYLHGEEAYLDALERHWISVYLSARESGILHDPDFPAATGFDLMQQIELLRDEIDKNEVQRSLTRPIARHHLPLELSATTDFTESWKEEFAEEPVEKRFEPFYTNDAGVTTKRLETLTNTALGFETASACKADVALEHMMAEWAVRIVIATASSTSTQSGQGSAVGATQEDIVPVDEMTKADFCRSIGDTRIEEAMQRLLDAKLIRPLTVDPVVRRKPGTNFVFTEELHRLLPDLSAGTRLAAADLQATLTHRRSAFQEICDAEDGSVVEPIEADGEVAALLPLIEAGMMDAEIDRQPFEFLRQNPALNARVMNDEDLEAMIWVNGNDKSGMMDALDAAVTILPAVPQDRALDWLVAAKVNRDVDTHMSASLAETLQTIWLQQFETTLKTVSSTDVPAAERLRVFGSRLIECGPVGLSLESNKEITYSDVLTITSGSLPLAFFSPLSSSATLIASPFIQSYTLTIPTRTATTPPQNLTLPHIWTTLTINTNPSTATVAWRSLLETIIALTLQRPGITLVRIASRFSTTLTVGTSFADVWTATLCLLESGMVELRTDDGGVQGWTLHPGLKCIMWAGFR